MQISNFVSLLGLGYFIFLFINSLHHNQEFFEADQTVAVYITLFDNLIPNLITAVRGATEDLFDFIGGDGSTLILIKHVERNTKIFIVEYFSFIDCSGAPFTIINSTATINICDLE